MRNKHSKEKAMPLKTAAESIVPPEHFAQYVEELGMTQAALHSLLRMLYQEEVPHEELDSRLRQTAAQHKQLLLCFAAVCSGDSAVDRLKKQAGQAVRDGNYPAAEELLRQVEELDYKTISRLQESIEKQQAALEQRQISASANCGEQALLLRLQNRSVEAAELWQEAAALLPDKCGQDRAKHLNSAREDYCRAARYSAALTLSKQSLSFFRAIGDWEGERTALNSISRIYEAQGDYQAALRCLKQSLLIAQQNGIGNCGACGNIGRIYSAAGDDETALHNLQQSLLTLQEVGDLKGEGASLNDLAATAYTQGDHAAALQYYEQSLTKCRQLRHKRGEGAVLNNISAIYYAQDNYDAAFKYLEESLLILREIGDQIGEMATLNNIATTAYAKDDSSTALKYLQQSLAIAEEISSKKDEAVISGNIGIIYKDRGEFSRAEPYLNRTVALEGQLEQFDLEEYRKALEEVRAKLRKHRR